MSTIEYKPQSITLTLLPQYPLKNLVTRTCQYYSSVADSTASDLKTTGLMKSFKRESDFLRRSFKYDP